MAALDSISEIIKPALGGSGTFVTIISILAIFFLIAVMSGIIIYFGIMWLKFNEKIKIYENIAGKGYQHIKTDKAMRVGIGDSGEQVLRLRKHKLFRSAYGRRTGKKEYSFAVGDDGYWYNFVHGDLNKALSELSLKIIDKDPRYAYSGIRKTVKDAFSKKESQLIKFLPYIGLTILMIVFGIGMWFSTRNYIDAMGTANQVMDAAKQVLEASAKVLGNLDNVVSGSGVRPA